MLLKKFAEAAITFTNEKCQVVDIQLRVRLVFVFPDEAALVPVLRKGVIREDSLILILCIHIEDKHSARMKEIIHSLQDFDEILTIRYIVHTVTDTDYTLVCTEEIQVSHILTDIENRIICFMRPGYLKHLVRRVHACHIIA